MKYGLYCASCIWNRKDIVDKYPVIKKYKLEIDYPYPNRNLARLMIEVDNVLEFYKDVGQPIIIDQDKEPDNEIIMTITIYDDWIE